MAAHPDGIPVAALHDGTGPRLSASESALRRLSIWDLIGMTIGFGLIVAITVVNSRGRVFWEDEMLGWLLLRDPSWHHMLRAWNLGADGGGFSFYLLGRGWFRLFGDSALAFRLFSSTCFGVGLVATWAALRRFYPVAVVAFAIFNSFLFSPPLSQHFLEGRFYGLLVMSTALALWLVLVLDEVGDPLPARFLLAAFLVNGLLTTSHVLGIVFSAFLFGALVVLDRCRGRVRLRLYAAIGCAWLLLIPERTSILAAGRVGKPHFWTTAPTPATILGAYTGFSHEILLVLVVLLCGAGLRLSRSHAKLRRALNEEWRERRALYVVTLSLLLVPIAFLLEGLVGTWLFTDRYLQPVVLGTACLTAELAFLAGNAVWLQRVKRQWPKTSVAVLAGAAVCFAALALYWDFHHVAELTPEPVDFTAQLTAHLPHDIPVVVEDAFTFTELMAHESNAGVNYVYLLDWPYSTSAEAPRLEVTQFHLMQNWKLAGYFPGHIQEIHSFLQENPRFLVLHNAVVHPDPQIKPEIGNPLTMRFQRNPAYVVQPFFVLDRLNRDGHRDTVSLVCRGSCGGTEPRPAAPLHCVLGKGGTTRCDEKASFGSEAESGHGLRTKRLTAVGY